MMQNIKLHEATKEFGISNKLAMFFLVKINKPVKSHSSVISMDQLELLREFSSHQDKFPHITDEFDKIEEERKERARARKRARARGEEPAAPEEKPKPAAPKAAEPKKEPPKAAERVVEKERERVEERAEERVIEKERERVEEKTREKKIEKREENRAAPRPARRHRPKKKPKRFEKPKAAEQRPAAQRPAVDREQRKEIDRAREPRKVPKRPVKRREERFKFKKGQKIGRERAREIEARKKKKPEILKKKPEVLNLPEMIQISNFTTVKELAEKLNIKLKYLEEKMRQLKKEYAPNQMLDIEEIKEICQEFKVEVDIVSFEDDIFSNHIEKFAGQQSARPPVVTVMGHVDHGKTTLLDTLRNTRVAAREAGGITQKIGAYRLDTGGHEIIFVDTPGHEAFTNIRSRGARVTDVVILVVAANDGVQPQTVEAINHAKAAKVPLIVAINKIDLPGVDINKIKQDLANHNVLVEDWGGDVVCVEISAKENRNLDALVEMVGLVAEMSELQAYKDIPGRGTIIESRLDPQLGPLGTVLIQHGKIKRGDFFICGNAVGKVKSIFDDQGAALNEAAVPLPVEIMGFEDVPEAGERFQVTDEIEKARKVIDMRKLKEKEAKKEEIDSGKRLSLQNLFEKLEEGKIKEFPVIIKTDNFSSGEVVEKLFLTKNQEKLKINIVHKGIGNITESDILLAATSAAMIIGFNIKMPQKIVSLARREKVEIKLYNVIYHLIEEMEKAIKGEIEPEYIENRIGVIEVLQKFKISRVGIIAGCLVKEGKVTNKSKLKVIRNNDLVFEGEVETLKRVKNDVSEVSAGTECGIRVRNFNDIEVGDTLEAYEVKVKE